MSAYPGVGLAAPASAKGFARVSRSVCEADRRVVAVAVDAVELLRPGSDLARLLEGFGRADVLLAADDRAATVSDDLDDNLDDNLNDDLDDDLDGGDRDGEVADQVRTGAARLQHPDLFVHRLALCPPLSSIAEDDLVAALSELVGFDPEPGVYCLAPATPADSVVVIAAQRIARVYGLPLLRYRCLEFSLVTPDGAPISSPLPRHAARG